MGTYKDMRPTATVLGISLLVQVKGNCNAIPYNVILESRQLGKDLHTGQLSTNICNVLYAV